MGFDGYVRVSVVGGRSGERFISPVAQRQEIERWAALHRTPIGRVFVELDESGARADRPQLLEAVDRIELGESDGLVVARLDRFGRSLLDALRLIERIEAAGGMFVSVAEGLDARSYVGRFALRVMFAMAEMELDRIRANWDTAREHAFARGTYRPRDLPVGYVADELRRLHPDPEVAPVVREAYRMRVDGASWRDLVTMLEGEGIATPRGFGCWTRASVVRLLGNPVYRGQVKYEGVYRDGIHQPLVEADVWHAAQATRRVGTAHSSTHGGLLSGLLRCAGCQRPMSFAWLAGHRNYLCRREWSSGRCPDPVQLPAAPVELFAERAFFSTLRHSTQAVVDRGVVERARQAEAALVAYRDHPTLLLTLGPDRFQAGLARRLERVTDAQRAVAADRARVTAARDVGSVRSWSDAWPGLGMADRRRVLAGRLDAVFAGKAAGYNELLAWAVARGHATAGLPAFNQPGYRPQTFEPAAQPVIEARDTPLWGERRTRAALARFLDHHQDEDGRWPSEDAFVLAGCGPLLDQIDRTGGRDAWARRTGLRFRRARHHSYWTDDRIRASITEVMRGRTTWPSTHQWEQIGAGGLWGAIVGRNREWATEFGCVIHQGKSGPTRWTDARIDHELRALATRTGGWYPRHQDFKAAGLGNLYQRLTTTGRHAEWSRRLNLPARPNERRDEHRAPTASDLQLLELIKTATRRGQASTAAALAEQTGDPHAGARVGGRLKVLHRHGLIDRQHTAPGHLSWTATPAAGTTTPATAATRNAERYSDLTLLSRLHAAGPDGLRASELAAWVGDPDAGTRVAGRLKTLARDRLTQPIPQPHGPARWRATLPADHPAAQVVPDTARPTNPPRGTWPRELIIEALRTWSQEHGRAPVYGEWRTASPDRPRAQLVEQRFKDHGGWAGALTAAGLQPGRRARSATSAGRSGPTAPGRPNGQTP